MCFFKLANFWWLFLTTIWETNSKKKFDYFSSGGPQGVSQKKKFRKFSTNLEQKFFLTLRGLNLTPNFFSQKIMCYTKSNCHTTFNIPVFRYFLIAVYFYAIFSQKFPKNSWRHKLNWPPGPKLMIFFFQTYQKCSLEMYLGVYKILRFYLL